MNGKDENKLDNPVWNSLNETHHDFCIHYEGAKFYKPAYCPFGSFVDYKQASEVLTRYASNSNNFYVVGEQPSYNSDLKLHKNLICHQMVLKNAINIHCNEVIVPLQSNQQKTDLFHLVNLVQPGYFNAKTHELGSYFGIYKDQKLVAVTGERMKMNAFTEVSAVVTHPQHTGNGYAKQLIKHTTDNMFQEGKTPYLHVASTNIGAIKLYEKLGFVTRRKISFWNFKMI